MRACARPHTAASTRMEWIFGFLKTVRLHTPQFHGTICCEPCAVLACPVQLLWLLPASFGVCGKLLRHHLTCARNLAITLPHCATTEITEAKERAKMKLRVASRKLQGEALAQEQARINEELWAAIGKPSLPRSRDKNGTPKNVMEMLK